MNDQTSKSRGRQVDHSHIENAHISWICSCDLDPMTWIYELDLDILKMCLHTEKKEVLGPDFQKAQTGDTHTHRCD